MSTQKLVYFTMSGKAEIIGRDFDVELSPQEYRAYYEQYLDGKVIVTELQRKHGDVWLRDKLLNELDESLTGALERDYEREQQRMVEDWDSWRYGS